MTRVTRDVDPAAVRDLVERPPRACLAFAATGALAVEPVAFRFSAGRYWVGISRAGAGATPQAGAPVTLLIDDGWYWVELRAIKIRGRAVPADRPPDGVTAELNWLEVIPEKVVAWDYGSLREEGPHASR